MSAIAHFFGIRCSVFAMVSPRWGTMTDMDGSEIGGLHQLGNDVFL
jgi:hypothetical protein